MDLSETITPNSQQVNAEDLIASARTVTITGVEAGTAEQPVFVHLAEFPGRTYRPSKSMRRVMVALWGPEASAYTGHRLTLYRDPEVSFGREKVGGIKISHASHIDKPMTISLTVSRGKRSPITVQPLEDAPPAPDKTTAALTAIRNATEHAALDKIAAHAASLGIDVAGAIEARKQELG